MQTASLVEVTTAGVAENAQVLQCLYCKIHGKSCYSERDDTIVLVF